MQANVTQSNFVAGELSPKVRGRFDLKLFQNGLEKCENFIPELQGASRFRNGTRFVNHTRLNKVALLVPFQFSDEQAYVLEFTEGWMRVFRNEGAIVETSKTVEGGGGVDTFTKLVMHYNKWEDDSSYDHDITENGSISLTATDQKFDDNASFDGGSGDFLSIPDASDWDFGTGLWTVDFWIRRNGAVSTGRCIVTTAEAATGSGFSIEFGASHTIRVVHEETTVLLTSSGSISDTTWTHVAVVRHSTNTLEIFFDGVSQGTFTLTSENFDSSSQGIVLGRGQVDATGDELSNCKLDEFRWSKGVARWTTGFTPPTSAYSNPDSSTRLLLHFDNVEFVDDSDSAHSITNNGTVAYDQTNKKFKNASLDIVATGYLSIPSSNDWDFGTGDFTIDFWIRRNGVQAAGDGIIGCLTSAGDGGWSVQFGASSVIRIVTDGFSFNVRHTGTTSLADLTWTHVAVVRDGDTLRLFIDGVADGTSSVSGITFSDTNDIGCVMGREFVNTAGFPMDGQIDEMRVSKGIARWTSGFTPPTVEYTSTDGASQTNPVVINSPSHGYSNGDEVFISNVEGMEELNGKYYIVANATTDTFEITNIDGTDIDGTGFGAWTTGGTLEKLFELAIPYLENELFELKFAQNADLMYITHQNHDIIKLTRTDHNVWSTTTFARTADPFPSQAITDITQANPAVVTYSGADSYVDGQIITIQEVVGMTEVNGNSYIIANINTGVNTFELQDLNTNNIDSTGFTAYSSGGKFGSYPRAVAFYEGRLFYGGTKSNPEKFWGSRAPTAAGVTRYDDFTTGSNADDAVIFTLSPSAQGEVDNIQWLSGSISFLACGTFGGITKITGDGVNEPITPSSINAKPVSDKGCKNLSPLPRSNIILYAQRGGLTLRSFEFDVFQDDYVSVDRNLVSDHIFKTDSTIKQLSFQSGRPDAAWIVRNDGQVASLSFKAREDVSGWARHKFGGTDVKVLSVATVPRPDDIDQVWLVVERTINSLTRRYVEFIEGEVDIPEIDDFYSGDANKTADDLKWRRSMFEKQKEYIHADSVLTYDGTDAGVSASAAITPGATTGSGITFTSDQNVFESSDVGREIWKKAIKGVGTGRAEITGFTDAKTVTCTISEDFDNTNAIVAGNWYLTATTISGLDHLEGEVVKVITDGAVHTDETVSGGSITVDYDSSVVHIGLGYTGLMKSMNLEVAGVNGSAQTKPRNIEKAIVRLLNTLGARIGTDRYNLEGFDFDFTIAAGEKPDPLFSGNKEVIFEDQWEIEKHVYIEQKEPLPCIVQAVDVYGDATNE